MSSGKKIFLWVTYYVIAFVVSMALVSIPDWFGAEGGVLTTEGQRIDNLFWGMVILSVAILSVILATMTFALIHFRAGPRDTGDGKYMHGNNAMELGWIVVPTIIVLALSWISYEVLVDNDQVLAEGAGERHDRGGVLEVDVIGFQYGWEFAYPEVGVATLTNYVIPVDEPVVYNVTARKYGMDPDGGVRPDVIHSFWVPASRIKQDGVPGYWSARSWTAERTGTFDIVCAELCGALHYQMLGEVCVVERGVYDAWLVELGEATTDSDTAGSVSYPCSPEGEEQTLAVRSYQNDDELLGIFTEEQGLLLESTLEASMPAAKKDTSA